MSKVITPNTPPTDSSPSATAPPRRRRGFLAALVAGAAVPLAVSGTPSAALGEDADAVLLVAYRNLLRAEADSARLTEIVAGGEYALYDRRQMTAFDDATGAMLDRWHPAADLIRATPALTRAGLRAKAHAMEIVLANLVCTGRNQTIADIEEVGDYQDTFALSLARDVMAGVGS